MKTNVSQGARSELRARCAVPSEAEILEAGGKGGTGNVTLLFRDLTPPLVLKVYRTRGSLDRECLRTFSNGVFEKKRGAGPWQRMRTEQATLSIWAREGFAVPNPVQRALPAGIAGPALWLSYMTGTRLSDMLDDPAVALEDKLTWIRRYAGESAPRHGRAFALREPLLTHEHPAACHVMVAGETMVTFDFENGYRSGCPVLEAASAEVAGFLRTATRHLRDQAPLAVRAYAEGYGDRDLLLRLVRHYTEGRSLYRRVKRMADRRRHSAYGKTWAMQMLRATLG